MSDNRTLALKRALKMETDGMAYYQAARERADSDVGRNMFEFLRSSEEGHIARIHEIFRGLRQGDDWPAPTAVEDVDAEKRRWKSLFGAALDRLREQPYVTTDDLGALKMAAQFESDGQAFYRECAAAAQDPFERRFYEQLAAEEEHHLEALRDSIQLLEDPQAFFAAQESGAA